MPQLVLDHMDARVQHVPLLKRGAQRAVESVLEVEVAPPSDDVGEQVAEEGRVLVEQGRELKRVLGGHQLVEPQRVRRQGRPVPSAQAVLGIWPPIPNPFENHLAIIGNDS